MKRKNKINRIDIDDYFHNTDVCYKCVCKPTLFKENNLYMIGCKICKNYVSWNKKLWKTITLWNQKQRKNKK